MNIAFAGTPEFAAVALRAILDGGLAVSLALTQPDRPAGRGMQVQASPVKLLAQTRGVAVHQPDRLKDPATHQALIDAAPDVLVVAAYGLILPQAVLDIPRLGCVNIHASLLPRWRGAAPIQRAIEAGDAHTGVTLMQMEAGLDTGPMLLQEALPIAKDDTAASLHDKLAALGARMIVAALPQLAQLPAVAQPQAGVTYARKIEKTEALIDWRQPATTLARRLRAFTPFPGLHTHCRGAPLKILAAQALPATQAQPPGAVLAASHEGIVIACGEGALRITELQKAGGRRLSARDFLSGHPLAAGDLFG